MSTYLTRFTARQRTEHALVMSLFVILSVTGLPQKYFDEGWARWMIDLMGASTASGGSTGPPASRSRR